MRATPKPSATLLLTGLGLALGLALPGAAAARQSDDPARVADLAAKVAKGEWLEQRAAIAALQEDHGAYAVNGLLPWIGGQADVEDRVRAVYALRRLGRESALAMVAALKSGDAMTRRSLCMALEEVGDPRAVPALAAVAAHDSDPLAREQAAQAMARLGGGGGDAVALLTDLAERFHSGDAAVLGDGDERTRVFFWNGKKVASREVTAEFQPHAYARLCAEDALALDPANLAAQAALVAAYQGMLDAVQAGNGGDFEELAGKLADLVALGGAAPRTAGEDEEGGSDEMLNGASDLLHSESKRLRYKAALALAGGSPSAEVVRTLGDALAESAVRQVLVIDNDSNDLNRVVGMLKGRETTAVGAPTGAQGLVRAKATPVKDAIIVRSTVTDVSADKLVTILARDVRTKDVPVIVVADAVDVDRMQALLGDRVVGVVPAPINMPVLKPALDAAFERAALNDQRMEAEQFSRRAAEALARLDAGALSVIPGALVGAIGREDAVQIPALRAVAKVGMGEAQAPALALLDDASASSAARVAAALALEGVLANHDAQPETLASLRAALGGEDAALRAAAARALGAARSIDATQRSQLLLANGLSFATGE